MNRIILALALCLLCAAGLCAQQGFFDDDWPDEAMGDAAIAEKYLLWAEDAIAGGHWAQALAALERAADFADVSSDISYLLAVARSEENESRGLVLEALERAIATGHWRHYTEAQARLLEADHLITLRYYSEALKTLDMYQTIAGENADMALLRLAALKGIAHLSGGDFTKYVLVHRNTFRQRMHEALNRYPRDPRPLRILFSYAVALRDSNQRPSKDDILLVDAALNRLPFVIESDPELAWMAAPFVSNVAEGRRLVAAYRSGSFKPRQSADYKPKADSIAPALNVGLIDDFQAIDELFSETVLEKELIVSIGKLLRSEEGRNYLAQKLHSFTGAITGDEDRDGYPESRAIYRQGGLQEYYSDTDQDGITDLYIQFISGTPQQAEVTSGPLQGSRTEALVFWERYPSVQRTEVGSEIYLPSPGGFQFAPVNFEEIGISNTYAGLLFPRNKQPYANVELNRRMLVPFTVSIQRPSPEFEGGIEQILLERGIPLHAEVTLNGQVVLVTEFENGYPLVQRADLDADGRMETVRHFDRSGLRSLESDWHGDGIFGSAERYRTDGSVVYSWDLDGDGMREYSEARK